MVKIFAAIESQFNFTPSPRFFTPKGFDSKNTPQ